MVVLGIDPGTLHLGWGVVGCEGQRLRHLDHGIVHTDAKAPLGDRLVQIEAALVDVVARHRPTEAGVESMFFAHDPLAAAKLGHARGVVLLVLARAGVPLSEYPPARVKRAVGANGRAEKAQVARMVQAMLALREIPAADAADALAVAITHVQMEPARRMAMLAGSVVGSSPVGGRSWSPGACSSSSPRRSTSSLRRSPG